MIPSGPSRHRLLPGLALALGLAVVGCDDGTPNVSSSTEEATVKGTVSYKGKKATKGTITFDPANVKRKMVSPSSATIGEDGTYTIKTLVGENMVSFDLPEFAKDRAVGYLRLPQEVGSGESTADFDLPPKL